VLTRSAWGQGFATEACRWLLAALQEYFVLNEIVATVDVRNLRSLRVLERLVDLDLRELVGHPGMHRSFLSGLLPGSAPAVGDEARLPDGPLHRAATLFPGPGYLKATGPCGRVPYERDRPTPSVPAAGEDRDDLLDVLDVVPVRPLLEVPGEARNRLAEAAHPAEQQAAIAPVIGIRRLDDLEQ